MRKLHFVFSYFPKAKEIVLYAKKEQNYFCQNTQLVPFFAANPTLNTFQI